jgi:Flp pilus assembly protein TadG
MQAVSMRRRSRAVVLAALVLALGAVLAFALLSGGTRTAQAAVRHATKHAAHHATHHARHHAAKTSSTDPTTTTDGDNVQSGDQSTSDTPSETSGEGTPSSEDQLQPGEPAGGHQDPSGNVDNNCQDCTTG